MSSPGSGGPESGGPRRVRLDKLFEALQREEAPQVKVLSNSVGMKLVLVPDGSFTMGSTAEESIQRANEMPAHEVILSQAFYMTIHPVTQAQYEQVVGRNPSLFHPGNGGSLEHPVEQVSWEDAVTFCRLLTEERAEEQAGLTYRLPTEAEWEYACRAGSRTLFHFGKGLSSLQANIDGDFPAGGAAKGPKLARTCRVGSYPANNFGLFDMHGNVWEWCEDWFSEYYYGHSTGRDPGGPSRGQFRIMRGGCWRSHGITCRSAYRNALVSVNRDPYTGFRVVAQKAQERPGVV